MGTILSGNIFGLDLCKMIRKCEPYFSPWQFSSWSDVEKRKYRKTLRDNPSLRQIDSTNYELSLRRDEIAEMEKSNRRPGVIGVSQQWLRRHDELKEKIINLDVRRRELIGKLPPE